MRSRLAVTAALLLFALSGCSSTRERAIQRYLDQAVRHLQHKQFAKADSAIGRAIRLDPARTSTYEAAIGIYESKKQWRRGAEIARELVNLAESHRLDPRPGKEELAGFYLGLAWLAQQDDDLRDAEISYKKALALAPDSANLLNALGYFYADEGIRLNEALRLTRRAAELAPDSGAIADSLGWAQYKLGRYKDAADTLRRAVTLEPNEPEIRYHLGAAYLKLGQKWEARVEIEKALALRPDLREAAKLLTILHK